MPVPENELYHVLKPLADILEPLSQDQKRRVLAALCVMYGLEETEAMPGKARR